MYLCIHILSTNMCSIVHMHIPAIGDQLNNRCNILILRYQACLGPRSSWAAARLHLTRGLLTISIAVAYDKGITTHIHICAKTGKKSEGVVPPQQSRKLKHVWCDHSDIDTITSGAQNLMKGAMCIRETYVCTCRRLTWSQVVTYNMQEYCRLY